MVRVLQVIDNMNAGGMETMLMNYYRKIDRNKIQFDFLIFHKEHCLFEDEIENLGGKIYKITSRRENFLKNRRELKIFFKTHKYNIVEFHQGITYYYPLIIAKKYGIENRIIHNHGINLKYLKILKIYNNLYLKKRISNLANYYFTCAKEVENHLFSNKIIKDNKAILVNNAIDLEKFKFSSNNREKIRKEFNINKNEMLIGHIGSFTIPKNHLFLLQIFEEISKMKKNVKLLLVGTGPLEDQIIKKIKDLNLEDKIIITKNRQDVNEIMSALDCLIFPSIFEGIPLTLIEAQTAGVPIYISNTINPKSKVIDNGMVISLKNEPKIWAETIINDNHHRIEKEKCFNLMKKTNFNIDTEAKKIENIYLKMLFNN